MSEIITVKAPVNIAVIKYWGKRDENLILPLNDSVSGTLDTDVMCAMTSVCARPDITENEIWLNGSRTTFDNPRLKKCLGAIKSLAASQKSVSDEFLTWNVRICSENNFPTAAGLASSAAGYACLVCALAKLYKVTGDVSSIARLGSGSACRSVYGGFVQWKAGVRSDGSDSVAVQVVDSKHWPEMRVLILVVADTKKHVSSKKGMKISAETSELMQHRIKHSVPRRTVEICDAIRERDFETFAEITMKDSNQMHAVVQDSYPPSVYMTDISHRITRMIHTYNDMQGSPKVAYTFDAGPNACLYLLEENVPEVLCLVKQMFPSSSNNFVTGLPLPKKMPSKVDFPMEPFGTDLLKNVIYTKIGDGPQVVKDDHLLDQQGRPKRYV
ncbi:diphosphomevalonate decarboxylase [Aricia agestis]|uniref:diphosphomevalonate decarboxylase n=1 Tax=Aricia agestis TaxID=91739 RepID=UPI001C208F18|nr:diphosphomevalonate decarboxylase [Aricia agestis]